MSFPHPALETLVKVPMIRDGEIPFLSSMQSLLRRQSRLLCAVPVPVPYGGTKVLVLVQELLLEHVMNCPSSACYESGF